MKNVFIAFVLILSFQLGNAQEFIETDLYTINSVALSKGDGPSVVTLSNRENTANSIASFTIQDAQTFEGISISALKNPGLDGVSEVIKAEIEYVDYCSYVVTHYFLITSSGDSIGLPILDNVYCNDTTSDIRYLFPNQAFGKANRIIKSEIFYSNHNQIKSVNEFESFAWNDDSQGSSAKIDENY